jgi:hypothetical protein
MDRNPTRSAALVLALLALLACLPRPARAEIGACQVISSLPTTITVTGRYCLDQDIAGTYNGGSALAIRADNVVFDCADHRLTDTNPANTNAGIMIYGDHDNVTVRNCVIDGFQTGILVQESADGGSSGEIIQDNTFLHIRQVAIWASMTHSLIERNQILGNTGNSNGTAIGIRLYSSYANGVGNVIRDNVIADFEPTPPPSTGTLVIGIQLTYVNDTEITGNTLSALYSVTNNYTYAIDASSGTGTVLTDNRIIAPPPRAAPLDGQQWYGIRFSGTPEQLATNLCRGNTVGHFATNIVGCTQVDNTTY